MKGSGHTDIKSWLFVPSNAKIKCLSDILVVGVLIHRSLALGLIGSGASVSLHVLHVAVWQASSHRPKTSMLDKLLSLRWM